MAFRPGEGSFLSCSRLAAPHPVVPGCHHLALWRDTADPDVFFTHSHWEGEADRSGTGLPTCSPSVAHREGALFREPAAAWSVHEEVRMP